MIRDVLGNLMNAVHSMATLSGSLAENVSAIRRKLKELIREQPNQISAFVTSFLPLEFTHRAEIAPL